MPAYCCWQNDISNGALNMSSSGAGAAVDDVVLQMTKRNFTSGWTLDDLREFDDSRILSWTVEFVSPRRRSYQLQFHRGQTGETIERYLHLCSLDKAPDTYDFDDVVQKLAQNAKGVIGKLTKSPEEATLRFSLVRRINLLESLTSQEMVGILQENQSYYRGLVIKYALPM